MSTVWIIMSFFILTNDQATNFKLMKCDLADTRLEVWEEVIAHRSDVFIEDFELFADYLVLEERSGGLPHLRVIGRTQADGSEEDYYIEFNDPTYYLGASANFEFDTTKLRFVYSSFTTPNSTYDFDMNTRERELLKRKAVLGDFKVENYKSEYHFATARDGVKVPVSLVYHKDTPLDGSAPLLLYAYGSYGASMPAFFNSNRLSLLDRGFIYAIAHIRGGQEMGRQWYEDGKFKKKMNTFNDFIDCAEYLIGKNYCVKEKLVIQGGSAGGMLMGGVINLRPDLFQIAVAEVPFVDVVSTMLDDSIPLTTNEYKEWGNPNEEDFYRYMLSYSPYDNVEAKSYPHLLVTAGINDSQVHYWEPAKWVAKMRHMRQGDNRLLFKVNMGAGHVGASGRYDYLKEIAFVYAFIFDTLGMLK